MGNDVDRLADEIVRVAHEQRIAIGEPDGYSRLTAAVASLLRARLPRWVEVTDDPATWAATTVDDGSECLLERPNGDRDVYAAGDIFWNASLGRWRGFRHMPWPASPAKEEK